MHHYALILSDRQSFCPFVQVSVKILACQSKHSYVQKKSWNTKKNIFVFFAYLFKAFD